MLLANLEKLQYLLSYRQLDSSTRDVVDKELFILSNRPQHREPVDLNWRSINVPPSDNSNSFTVQNLSQDTTYEFYVRAKNIIGDGPKSSTVTVTTKKALEFGSLTPVDPTDTNADALASSLGRLNQLIALENLFSVIHSQSFSSLTS